MPDQRKFLTFGPRVAIIVVGNEGNDESTLMGRSGKSAVESGASRPKSNRERKKVLDFSVKNWYNSCRN
jgi:hypothetical protein